MSYNNVITILIIEKFEEKMKAKDLIPILLVILLMPFVLLFGIANMFYNVFKMS